jgi:enoyl-CoA hydratase/carnithine racemase
MTIETKMLGRVLWATIERETALNSLDIPHLRALVEMYRRAKEDLTVQAVVLTGKGRAFSVGADIKAMDVMTDLEFSQAAELYQSMCREARALDKPVIAAINGFCLSGGLEVALMADIRIAASSAKLGLTDAELGFSPTGGLTYLLNHIVGAGWALHLAMTAQILSAEEGLRIGLVTQVVDDAELEPVALALGRRLGAFPPTGMKNIKRSFNAALEASLASTLTLEAEYDAACYRSKETRQALRDFIESRKKRKG